MMRAMLLTLSTLIAAAVPTAAQETLDGTGNSSAASGRLRLQVQRSRHLALTPKVTSCTARMDA